MDKSKIVIFDLDGTLALDHHRNHHLHGEKRDWETYFSLCHLDAVNLPIVEILRAIRRNGYSAHILSGRSEIVYIKTLEWLRIHGIQYESIRMREIGDHTDDHELKISWGAELGGPDRVLFVVEDRKRVVKAWRQAGYTVLQCAEGDF